jgi:hypothetical protein
VTQQCLAEGAVLQKVQVLLQLDVIAGHGLELGSHFGREGAPTCVMEIAQVLQPVAGCMGRELVEVDRVVVLFHLVVEQQ